MIAKKSPAVRRAAAPRKSLVQSRRTRETWSVTFPEPGRVRLQCPQAFASWHGADSRSFIEASLGVAEVREVEIDTQGRAATLSFETVGNAKAIIRKIAGVYRGEFPPDGQPKLYPEALRAWPRSQSRLRVFRYGQIISTWEPRLAMPGWLRVRHALILNKRHLVQLIERELMALLGITRYKLHPGAGSISIEYNPRLIHPQAVVHQLDLALAKAPVRAPKVRGTDTSLPLATASLTLSATTTFLAPALLPVGAAAMLLTAVPSYRRAYEALFRERRLGVDVLDSIIFTACLFTGQIFAGAMTAWFLSIGRQLLRRTEDESSKVLLSAFGKQPSMVWRHAADGAEVETPLEKIRAGDRIVVHPGEAVPVDGVIRVGDAMLDQHQLTGEAAPAEKTVGDAVFASTVMLAGHIVVEVQKAGKETAASKIGRILRQTVAYKPRAQSQGERLADQAVVPTLGLAAVAAAAVSPSAALAIIYSDLGTGIRMAAPLGLLSSLTLCARDGILIKDGRALERMREVDTVVFDKTGTLTREVPEVVRILSCGQYSEAQILAYAAAAEQKFTHPIAKAILDKFHEGKRPLPKVDDSAYQIGYGITVGIEGETVRVGSRRFMDMEGIAVPASLRRSLDRMHAGGHSCVHVAVGHTLAGILELQSSNRPEALGIIRTLRARGIKQLVVLSGDHEKPTRALAEQLGMDRHFAEVLPQDKARYVQLLQKEGRVVCFIGDGINDAIALKQADVSISLRGASSIATDAAQVVFMKESLTKIPDLFDFSRGLARNMRRSWNLILLPNLLCVAGVFGLGFNLWSSVFINNASALAAFGNGILPLWQGRRGTAAPDSSGTRTRAKNFGPRRGIR